MKTMKETKTDISSKTRINSVKAAAAAGTKVSLQISKTIVFLLIKATSNILKFFFDSMRTLYVMLGSGGKQTIAVFAGLGTNLVTGMMTVGGLPAVMEGYAALVDRDWQAVETGIVTILSPLLVIVVVLCEVELWKRKEKKSKAIGFFFSAVSVYISFVGITAMMDRRAQDNAADMLHDAKVAIETDRAQFAAAKQAKENASAFAKKSCEGRTATGYSRAATVTCATATKSLELAQAELDSAREALEISRSNKSAALKIDGPLDAVGRKIISPFKNLAEGNTALGILSLVTGLAIFAACIAPSVILITSAIDRDKNKKIYSENNNGKKIDLATVPVNPNFLEIPTTKNSGALYTKIYINDIELDNCLIDTGCGSAASVGRDHHHLLNHLDFQGESLIVTAAGPTPIKQQTCYAKCRLARGPEFNMEIGKGRSNTTLIGKPLLDELDCIISKDGLYFNQNQKSRKGVGGRKPIPGEIKLLNHSKTVGQVPTQRVIRKSLSCSAAKAAEVQRWIKSELKE